jgi:hypothetical protein
VLTWGPRCVVLCCVVLCCVVLLCFALESITLSLLKLIILSFLYLHFFVWLLFRGFHFGLGCCIFVLIIHLLLVLISWAAHPNLVFFIIKNLYVCVCEGATLIGTLPMFF